MSAPSVARHRIRWKATVALAGALVGPASAVWAAQAPQDIVAVVKRIQEAAQRRSFVGT